MAKEQSLSLNPTKISGLCDRLMCCLKYEQDQYEATRKRMPRVGREIITPDGVGTINAINVLEETVRVRIAVGDAFELREYPIDDCQRPETPAAPQGERGEKPERREKAERSDRPERGERPERREKADRGEHPERREKGDRPERGERPPKGKRAERGENPERAEKGERPERFPRRGEKPGKTPNARPAAQEAPAEGKQMQQESAPVVEADVLQIVEESVVEDLL